MSIIRILPEQLSNRIAAGEVIERPASIVKELVENALDAGATRINVHIERGGRSLVKVADDGCGMDAEDALMCLEAHATSKIKEAEDIENIRTLGFRGEALPSIASVSRFQLQTRQPDSLEGTEVLVEGGVVKHTGPVGCPTGTTISAANLFYNMPARKKFLRTVATEEAHIQEMVLTQALANHNVAFELTYDGRQVLAARAGADLRTRATMLLGKDLMHAMLPVSYEESGIKVWGFVARPGLTRTNRKDQRTFVNGRAVQSDTLYFAIRDAYHTMVMKGRFPPVLLFMELSPQRVDINVHPAKREVRFREVRLVGQVFAEAVRQGLKNLVAPHTKEQSGQDPFRSSPIAPPVAPMQQGALPDFNKATIPSSRQTQDRDSFGHPKKNTSPEAPTQPVLNSTPPVPLPSRQSPNPVVRSTFQKKQLPPKSGHSPEEQSAKITSSPEKPVIPQPPIGAEAPSKPASDILNLDVLGVLNEQYILAQGPSGLVLIDQRAAHERILFEKTLKLASAKAGAGQGLLIPVTLDLSPADAAVLKKNVKDLQALGFEISDFGSNTFIVNACPAHFPEQNVKTIIRRLVDDLNDQNTTRKRGDEQFLAASVCHSAVRTKAVLKPEEIKQLLHDLARTEIPYSCPRGRPTMVNISYRELDKKFGRR